MKTEVKVYDVQLSTSASDCCRVSVFASSVDEARYWLLRSMPDYYKYDHMSIDGEVIF